MHDPLPLEPEQSKKEMIDGAVTDVLPKPLPSKSTTEWQKLIKDRSALKPICPTTKKKTVSEVNKEYDLKRKRTFIPIWTTDFPWVKHTDGEMTCRYCLAFPQISDPVKAFVLGCTTFRRTKMLSHHGSTKHINCMKAYFARENPTEAPMNRLLPQIQPHVLTKMSKLL